MHFSILCGEILLILCGAQPWIVVLGFAEELQVFGSTLHSSSRHSQPGRLICADDVNGLTCLWLPVGGSERQKRVRLVWQSPQLPPVWLPRAS